MFWPFLWPVLLVSVAASGSPALVRLSNGVSRCVVQTDNYQLVVDTGAEPVVRMMDSAGNRELGRVGAVWVRQEGRRYASAAGEPRPHLHSLRSGPYLVELHVEKIVLRSGSRVWPGLAELSLYCYEDRVHLVSAFINPNGRWVNRGLYVYEAPEGHRESLDSAPQECGLGLERLEGSGPLEFSDSGVVLLDWTPLGIAPTVPAGRALLEPGSSGLQVSYPTRGVPWPPGGAHEVGAVVLIAHTTAEARAGLAELRHPLPTSAFEMTMGQASGYDPATGLYRITAQTSGTPDPPRGLRAGAHYTVSNDERPRRILVDQRDPWGGITGGILRDEAGEPLPVLIQFGLNFPELHQEAGEPGWATLTYPLELAPNERQEIRAEHLYKALSDRNAMYLTSLENVGDPLLLQTTVGQVEAHTLTTGPYPGPLTPGNELRVNDFRRIWSTLRVRSVSAILPTFFGYWDASGSYRGLMPGFVTIRETGPFLTEYTVQAATTDDAVSGRVRVWQAAHQDMTRLFTEVNLRTEKPITLDPDRPAALFFLRHHAFNPMAFRRFAYTAEDGSTQEGELTYTRSVVVNGAPMGERPLGCLYLADNPIDQGIPCSDITGNSGFVLLDWDVRFGGRAIRPGFYAFCTGAGDVPDGDYARDIAVVPAADGAGALTEIPAGSQIRYRAVQMVWGDNSSDYRVMEKERQRWALNPVRVKAEVGQVRSEDPPEVRAVEGRARFEVSGGADWLPVRVSGLRGAAGLHVILEDAGGERELGPGAPGEPWYNAWPDEAGGCGVTFLVQVSESGGPVRVTVGKK